MWSLNDLYLASIHYIFPKINEILGLRQIPLIRGLGSALCPNHIIHITPLFLCQNDVRYIPISKQQNHSCSIVTSFTISGSSILELHAYPIARRCHSAFDEAGHFPLRSASHDGRPLVPNCSAAGWMYRVNRSTILTKRHLPFHRYLVSQPQLP